MKKHWMRKIPLILLAVAAGITSFSIITMLLWNGIVSPVFHAGIITFWQAAGILLLSRILFGFRRGRGVGMCGKRAWMNKWRQMTPEQREQMHNMAYSYCCGRKSWKETPAAE